MPWLDFYRTSNNKRLRLNNSSNSDSSNSLSHLDNSSSMQHNDTPSGKMECTQTISNSSQLLQKIKNLFKSTELSDIKLIFTSEDEKVRSEFNLHRLILCLGSEVLRAMLSNQSWMESHTAHVSVCIFLIAMTTNQYMSSIRLLIYSLILSSIHPSINPSIYSSIHPSIHLFINPFIQSCLHASINASIYPLFFPFIHLSIHASFLLFIHASFFSSIHSFIHPCILPSFHPFIHSSMHPFFLLSIHSCIHAFIHSSIQVHLQEEAFLHPSLESFLSYFYSG